MVKPRIPKDNDFINQYGGAVNQYGTVGSGGISDQNAADFQKHMQVQEAQNSSVPKISPHELMSGQTDPQMNMSAEPALQTPAPENFGPPKVGPVETDTPSQFGPPGSNGFQKGQNQVGTQAQNSQLHSNSVDPSQQVGSRQQQMQAQVQNSQQGTVQGSHPSTLGAEKSQNTNNQSSGSGGDSGSGSKGKDSGATYKSVEKQEVDNMLQNAMAHMKFKDPDPSAWN